MESLLSSRCSLRQRGAAQDRARSTSHRKRSRGAIVHATPGWETQRAREIAPRKLSRREQTVSIDMTSTSREMASKSHASEQRKRPGCERGRYSAATYHRFRRIGACDWDLTSKLCCCPVWPRSHFHCETALQAREICGSNGCR